MTSRASAIRRISRNIFHHNTLRPGQEEAISAVLDGYDTLAVMPTGSGKSAIYQIPAVLLDGPTVIVSPLIALQKDQAEYLQSQDAGGAIVINSLLSPRAQEHALSDAARGLTEFLFLGPEQFSNPHSLDAIKKARPSLFVVDEAHCVSEWGHSFRPDYLQLKNVIGQLGHPIVLALTATANADTRAEIISRLGMRRPKVFVHGFDRPNIWLGAENVASEVKKRAMLLERIQRTQKPGIVYTNTRKHTEEISGELNSIGIKSSFYHGGLGKSSREAMQERFMEDDAQVIVATSAFGMGVDKPNVRFVFHFEPPDSIGAYYQEIGRAGRDGHPATAVLFYCANDLTIHKFFKGAGQITAADVDLVLRVLEDDPDIDTDVLRQRTHLSRTKLARVLGRLEECGAIEQAGRGMAHIAGDEPPPDAAKKATLAQSEMHEAELDRIEEMRTYAESLACRRAQVAAYFGEACAPACGNCDNCQGTGTVRAAVIAEAKMRAEQTLRA